MRSKSLPKYFHRRLITESLSRPNNLPVDFFYRFMRELPYKLKPQHVIKSPVLPDDPPSSHKRLPTPFERNRGSPHRPSPGKLGEGSSRAQKSQAVINNLSDVQNKEQENTSELLKKCKEYFNRKISLSKMQIYHQIRRDSAFSE